MFVFVGFGMTGRSDAATNDQLGMYYVLVGIFLLLYKNGFKFTQISSVYCNIRGCNSVTYIKMPVTDCINGADTDPTYVQTSTTLTGQVFPCVTSVRHSNKACAASTQRCSRRGEPPHFWGCTLSCGARGSSRPNRDEALSL